MLSYNEFRCLVGGFLPDEDFFFNTEFLFGDEYVVHKAYSDSWYIKWSEFESLPWYIILKPRDNVPGKFYETLEFGLSECKSEIKTSDARNKSTASP